MQFPPMPQACRAAVSGRHPQDTSHGPLHTAQKWGITGVRARAGAAWSKEKRAIQNAGGCDASRVRAAALARGLHSARRKCGAFESGTCLVQPGLWTVTKAAVAPKATHTGLHWLPTVGYRPFW